MDIGVYEYTEKTFVLIGRDTRNIKDALKEKCQATWNKTVNGWIVKKSKLSELVAILDDIVSVDFSNIRVYEHPSPPQVVVSLEKYFLVKGDTKQHRSVFKEMGGVWMSTTTVTGWLFPDEKKKEVKKILAQ